MKCLEIRKRSNLTIHSMESPEEAQDKLLI